MTELTMQLIKNVNRASYGDKPLKALDLLNIDHQNLVVKVSEVSFDGRIFYRHYETMFDFTYICILPDDGRLAEFEPIAHFDDIVSGRVEFESFELTTETDDPKIISNFRVLPRVFMPEFMSEEYNKFRFGDDWEEVKRLSQQN